VKFPSPPSALPTELERDGIRILECRYSDRCWQFFVSSTPNLAPAAILQRLKGRLQHALREIEPRAFRRNYRIESLGSARREVVENYIRAQPGRHPMADSRAQAAIESCQIFDVEINLSVLRRSSHGEFLYNLHLVLEHEQGWHNAHRDFLHKTRDMLIAACRKHELLLSTAGIVANHLHIAIGCGINQAPNELAVMFLNNLAHCHDGKAIYRPSYYVGTFGNIDHGAVRNAT
jgi:REP element-mobilizing transposase RayT